MRNESMIAGISMMVAGALAGAPAGAEGVNVYVQVPDNLADTDDPIPELQVFNNGKHPIEFEAFHGVPLTFLETKKGDGFVRPGIAMCGNGYAPRRIEAGQWESFPLWVRVDHGPGVSGTYRVALPYLVIEGKKKIEAEALSDPYVLSYGDVAPQGYEKGWTPGGLVIDGVESEPVDEAGKQSHSPEALFVSMRAKIGSCVADAQKTLPWIRGSFSLVVYRYPGPDAAVTFVDSSLLGSPELAKCIEAVPAPDGFTGKSTLHMAVTHPLPPAP